MGIWFAEREIAYRIDGTQSSHIKKFIKRLPVILAPKRSRIRLGRFKYIYSFFQGALFSFIGVIKLPSCISTRKKQKVLFINFFILLNLEKKEKKKRKRKEKKKRERFMVVGIYGGGGIDNRKVELRWFAVRNMLTKRFFF